MIDGVTLGTSLLKTNTTVRTLNVIAMVVHIPPLLMRKLHVMSSMELQAGCRGNTQTPRGSVHLSVLISGDFNHSSLSSLPTFKQYVSCPTRGNKTLDLLYANTKDAYTSSPLPPLGRPEHNLVYLMTVYKPLVDRQPAVTRTVRRWSDGAEEDLKDCFETTMG